MSQISQFARNLRRRWAQLAAVLAIWVCVLAVVTSAFVRTAGASDTLIYTFHDCAGPSPSTFTAVKTELPTDAHGAVSAAAAFRLTNGSAIYVVLSFGQGNFRPPGISHSGNATVMCVVNFNSVPTTVSGLLAPPQ